MRKTARGFTLVEILVVIVIVAILAVVGVVVFRGVSAGAKDSKRRADIDAVAKAYEIQRTIQYIPLTDDMFGSGKIPKDPSPAKSEYFNWLDSGGAGFKVCAALENNPLNACNTPTGNCFCKFSSQGDIPLNSQPAPESTQDQIGVGGTAISCDPSGSLTTTGLVAWWKMDESSWLGDCTTLEVIDSAGNNHGKACPASPPAPNPTTPSLSEAFVRAGNFRGGTDGDKITVPDSSALNFIGDKLSISVWIKPDTPMDWAGVVSKWATGTEPVGYRITFRNDSGPLNPNPMVNLTFAIVTSSGPPKELINNNFIDSQNTWHHVVAVYNGSMMKFYKNGYSSTGSGFQTPHSGNLVSSPGVDLVIGAGSAIATNQRYKGLIDDVRIYNKALTEAEVIALYNSGYGCTP